MRVGRDEGQVLQAESGIEEAIPGLGAGLGMSHCSLSHCPHWWHRLGRDRLRLGLAVPSSPLARHICSPGTDFSFLKRLGEGI